jgi:hypothetical protein
MAAVDDRAQPLLIVMSLRRIHSAVPWVDYGLVPSELRARDG